MHICEKNPTHSVLLGLQLVVADLRYIHDCWCRLILVGSQEVLEQSWIIHPRAQKLDGFEMRAMGFAQIGQDQFVPTLITAWMDCLTVWLTMWLQS